MTTSDDSEHADLSIELAVEEGMTKTVHRVKKNGTLKFENGSKDKPLTIRSTARRPPFVLPGCADPQSEFEVPPGTPRIVNVSGAYGLGDYFTYKAQIEGSDPEDPIVIIDRH